MYRLTKESSGKGSSINWSRLNETMTEPMEAAVLRDSVSRNVLMESLSRVMTYIGGIVSSAVLYRAVSESSSSL